jgi:hypothetical protein
MVAARVGRRAGGSGRQTRVVAAMVGRRAGRSGRQTRVVAAAWSGGPNLGQMACVDCGLLVAPDAS